MSTKTKSTVTVVTNKTKGRPVVATSARQQRLIEKAARAASNGGVVKRGRPATKKTEVAIEPVVETA